MSAAFALACAVLGAVTGAAVPRVAYRLSVARGSPSRSACAACAAPFPAGLSGWVRAGARCPRCRALLGPPGWLTAAVGALAAGLLGWAVYPASAVAMEPLGGVGGPPPPRLIVAASLALAAYLLTGAAGVLLGAIDLGCLRLPDAIVGPAFGAALLLLGCAAATAGTAAAASSLLRALLAALALSGVYFLLALLPGGNLGMGDVKLCALLGLLLGWLGWGTLLLGALLPHLLNAPVAAALLVARRAGRRTELPLGPALLAGALLAVVAHAALRA